MRELMLKYVQRIILPPCKTRHTIQLPSSYARRSVMQRPRQVAAAGGAPRV